MLSLLVIFCIIHFTGGGLPKSEDGPRCRYWIHAWAMTRLDVSTLAGWLSFCKFMYFVGSCVFTKDVLPKDHSYMRAGLVKWKCCGLGLSIGSSLRSLFVGLCCLVLGWTFLEDIRCEWISFLATIYQIMLICFLIRKHTFQ
ncbi:hypothetical protein HanPI659440_Chr09g0321471 [Helianthus annuus]|nr:hypothetical protein HanPI659440_Chr09g0321471 [Helianthus annuus]